MLIAGIYFDKKIERRLSGATWTLPAALYARPLNLEVGMALAQSALITELKLLNYRPVTSVEDAGQFSVVDNHVLIYRRAFEFPDRAESPALVMVNFDEQRDIEYSN